MPDPEPQPQPKPAPETFSREYVHELREEAKTSRQKATEEATRAKNAEEAREKDKLDASLKLKSVNSAADARVIRAELKALAIAAGMHDLDGLKLADTSTVKITDDGEVTGAAEMMEALKKAKPYLFGAASTSTARDAPKGDKPKPKLATEMTAEEYAKAKAAAIRR